tara:strand:- start:11592 stop:11825 length:234 start_codon:yes stop_codon:yes gene_type:complete
MIDSKIFSDIAQKLADSLPPGMKGVRDDIHKNFKSVLESQLSKLDLVTREEFDTQTKVLKRSREKLDQLEKQLANKS